MGLVMTIVDTWNDYRKHRLLGTLAMTGDYVSGGMTLSFALSQIKSGRLPLLVRISGRSSPFHATYVPGADNASGKVKFFGQQGVKAGTILTSDNIEIADGDTVTIGTTVYRFKNAPAQAYDVKRSGVVDTTLLNLARAINASGTAGTEYFAGTLAHPNVIASEVIAAHAFAITAKNAGLAANSIASTTTAAHLSFTGATLAGGTVTGNDEIAAGAVPADLSNDIFDIEAIFQKNC